MAKKVVDPHHAQRDPDYHQVINQIAAEGKCPFCPENFRYHREPILLEEGGWLLTRSSWPYPGTEHHFLLIARAHHEHLAELTAEDWQAIGSLVGWAEGEFQLPGGAVMMRFGATERTGATVCHLHAHLIVPQINQETKRANVVHFPIG